MSNLMPEVLKMLGVEYGEEFKLQARDTELYKNNSFFFKKDYGLYIVNLNGSTGNANDMVYYILRGDYKIVKLPWRPKDGDRYWTVIFKGDNKPSVDWYIWGSYAGDYTRLKLGLIYRTKEEALAHVKADYEKLTGRKLEQNDT